MTSVRGNGTYAAPKACPAAITQKGSPQTVLPSKNAKPWRNSWIRAAVRNETLQACPARDGTHVERQTTELHVRARFVQSLHTTESKQPRRRCLRWHRYVLGVELARLTFGLRNKAVDD